ncbi:MAG TPA: hypothetical protein VGK74_13165 [Symbiobacteriaceae bacterium]|jgi:hypothetical protein
MNDSLELIQDYRLVRSVGLALAAIAFLVSLARVGATDQPHEHARATDLLIKSAVVFLILAGDRMLAHGVSQWFGLSASSLPAFWQ